MKLGYRINWIIVLVALLIALPVAAQSEVLRLNRVQVDVWPDYDRAAVLVLVTGELPVDTTFPASIEFRLPAAAGEPNAVAQITDSGDMLNAPFQTQADGDATLVTVETTERNVRVEYYFPYSRNGDEVEFTYRWLGGVAADEFTVYFQIPAGAAAVATDSGFEDIGVQDDGRRYRRWPVGAVESNDTLASAFGYTAPLPSPTTTTPPPVETPEKEGSSMLPVAIAAIGGGLIGVGGGWYFATQRAPVQRSPRRKTRAAKTVFCRDCGDRIQTDDAFCRQCGAKVR